MNCRKILACVFILCGLLSATVAYGQGDGMGVLKDSVGKWKAEIKMWTPGSDEVMTSTGTESSEMLGENWLVSKFAAEMAGMGPFSGVGIIGYDAEKKKYVNHWVDSTSTSMSHFEGTYDAATKTLTMTGKDQMGEGKHTTVIKNATTRVFAMYAKMEGAKDFAKVMEITYTKE